MIKINFHKLRLIAGVILTGLITASLFAQDNPAPDTSVQDTLPRFARLAKMKGTAQLLKYGEQDTEWDNISVNMVISEGDKISTDSGSYLEIQYDNGMNLKIDDNTEVEFTDLGKDDSNNNKTSIYVMSGRARISVPRYYSNEQFYIETPDCFASFEEESNGEVEISESQSKITAYTGRAEVSGDKGQISLLAGEYTLVSKDSAPSTPEKAGEPYGNFNKWCSAQEQTPLEQDTASQYAPDVAGSSELDGYGRWINLDPYGWVWRPRVSADWRPYYYGHWAYTERFGLVWVSDEGWGWIPYHYGSWAYVWPEGWVWIPAALWGSCWVCWYEGPDGVYWCPMGPDGSPWFYHSHHYSHFDRWAYMNRDDFRHRCRHHREEPKNPGRNHKYATANLPDNTNWTKKVAEPEYQSIKPKQTLAQAPAKTIPSPKPTFRGQAPNKTNVAPPTQGGGTGRLNRSVANQPAGRTNKTSINSGVSSSTRTEGTGTQARSNIAPASRPVAPQINQGVKSPYPINPAPQQQDERKKLNPTTNNTYNNPNESRTMSSTQEKSNIAPAPKPTDISGDKETGQSDKSHYQEGTLQTKGQEKK